MKKLYIFILFAAAELCFAQTTLTSAANKPIVGDSFAGNTVTGTVDNTATGSGATFSNPSLAAGAAVTTSYVAADAAEITTFPGSNLKQDDGSTTVLLFKSTANKLEVTGLTNPTATLNFSVDNATYLQFPVAFGYNVSDNAKGTFTSALLSGIFKGTSVGTATSSGTLIIGGNTFSNVLRVKLVQNYNLYQATDTFYLFSIGNITTTTFLYYDNLRKFPLLTDTTGIVTVPLAGINQTENTAIAQSVAFLKTSEVSKEDALFMYPNPATDILNFDGLKKDQNLLKIYSLDGKLAAKKKINDDKVNISDLTSGNYFITISGNKTETKAMKLIKK